MARSIYRSSAEQDSYDQRATKELTLDTLRVVYEQQLHLNATQYLRNYKAHITITDEDAYPHNDPHLVWNAGAAHRLDYICAIGDKLGLHATLTGADVNLDYVFELCPHPHKQFSGKYAQLGADQASAFLHIGNRPGEEVYLYMSPREVLGLPPSSNDLPEPGFCTGTTVLQPNHARIVSAFLAYCLGVMVDVTSVYCHDPYSIPMTPEPMSWTFTNAL
jgi:hypothetical protein